jgi:hypothetical protein
MFWLIAIMASARAFEQAGAKAAAMNADVPSRAPAPISPPARLCSAAGSKAALKETTPRRGLLAVIGAARRRTGPGDAGTMDS